MTMTAGDDEFKAAARGPSVRVALSALSLGESPRITPIDADHVSVLAELDAEVLPPIVVHRATMNVIDGWHRLAAARQRGDTDIHAIYFDGTADEAFIEGVRANVSHGRPLTLRDRRRAAHRVISTHPDWSDRAISRACGLSPKTVARERRAVAPAGTVADGRIGLDGRVRPIDPEARRAEVVRLLEQRPDASPAVIADIVGVSPSTVRGIRRRLLGGSPEQSSRPSADAHDWQNDLAFRSTAEAASLFAWFEAHAIDDDAWASLVEGAPLSRAYLLADRARTIAQSWQRLAAALEALANRVH
jgi:hypothetical protein